jgi:hypothetical protein
VDAEAIQVRPAEDSDRRTLALLFAAVAEERDELWDVIEMGLLL